MLGKYKFYLKTWASIYVAVDSPNFEQSKGVCSICMRTVCAVDDAVIRL